MKVIITIFFLFIIHLSFGQTFQNGLILPDKNEDQEICCIYSPKDGFEIYDGPNGKLIGRLTRNVTQNIGDQSFYRIYFVDNLTKTEQLIGLESFQEIAYEVWALAYKKINGDFVNLNIENKNYWLKITDLQKVGFTLTNWQTFLSNNTDNLLGFYAKDPGLNLREQPNLNSRIIRTLKGDVNQISPTKEHRGNWTKVKVIISKEHPCSTDLTEKENIIEELEGWIKIVDDEGRPNVWYYSRGC
jgi:hypothetical protein